jgi:hypothetical protein
MKRQVKSLETINVNNVSQSIDRYVNLISRNNRATGKEYHFRLRTFEKYCSSTHKFNLDGSYGTAMLKGIFLIISDHIDF